jgi:small conductance mechanosensitive channel
LYRSKVEQTLASFAKNMIYYAILIFVIIAALGKLGVQTSSFVALIGAAGLAVGLSLQGTLANFAAGVMLIMFEPFKAGDTIEAAGATGKVQEIQIFNTILAAADNKKVIMPNSKITGDKIIVHPRS